MIGIRATTVRKTPSVKIRSRREYTEHRLASRRRVRRTVRKLPVLVRFWMDTIAPSCVGHERPEKRTN